MVRKNKGSADKSSGSYERPSESLERLGAILDLASDKYYDRKPELRAARDAAMAEKKDRNVPIEDYQRVVREQDRVISELQAGMRSLMAPSHQDLEGSLWNLAAFQLSDLSEEVSAARAAIHQVLQRKGDRHV